MNRGGIWNSRFGNHFRVLDNKLVEVDSDGTQTELGTFAGSGNRPVSMPYSFNTQGIVINQRFYLYDPVGGFRQVTDVNIGSPIDAVWVDGYYFLTDGENLYHTKLANEEEIDPLDFATSEFSPDPTLGVSLTTDNKVIAWNRYTTEYFANDASAAFAFSRLPSRSLKYGIVGTHCKAEIGGTFFFMGGPREAGISVYVLGVGDATEIASREVAQIIGEYDEDDLRDVVLETRDSDGYKYLIVHLPNETLLFNVNIAGFAGNDAAWSKLETGTEGDTWRAIHGIYEPDLGEWVYGDKETNTLAVLNNDIVTQYGYVAEAVLYTPLYYMESASIDELEIQTIPGFTVVDDATVFFSMTYDGSTYSSENTLQYGPPGQRTQRFIANRLGYVDNVVGMKLRWASRSKMCFSKAEISYG